MTKIKLSAAVLRHLGRNLDDVLKVSDFDVAPARLMRLVDRLAAALASQDAALTAEVRVGLLTAAPSLLAYALSLTRDHDYAEDLVQETMLKAWRYRGRYEIGTNLEGWLITILRHSFVSAHRKRSWEVEDPDEAYAARLSVRPEQEGHMQLRDFEAALHRLPLNQRQALLLVTIDGLSSENVAALMNCAVGTVKSRVARARSKLNEMLM